MSFSEPSDPVRMRVRNVLSLCLTSLLATSRWLRPGVARHGSHDHRRPLPGDHRARRRPGHAADVDSQGGASKSTGSELRSPTSHVASGTGQHWFMSDTPGRLPRHGARRDSRAPLLGHSPEPPDFGTSRHATCLYLRPTPPGGPGATSVAATRRTMRARPPVPQPRRRSAAPVIGFRRERQSRSGPPG